MEIFFLFLTIFWKIQMNRNGFKVQIADHLYKCKSNEVQSLEDLRKAISRRRVAERTGNANDQYIFNVTQPAFGELSNETQFQNLVRSVESSLCPYCIRVEAQVVPIIDESDFKSSDNLSIQPIDTTCSLCNGGIRFSDSLFVCLVCQDLPFCSQCEATSQIQKVHDVDHPMVRIRKPEQIDLLRTFKPIPTQAPAQATVPSQASGPAPAITESFPLPFGRFTKFHEEIERRKLRFGPKFLTSRFQKIHEILRCPITDKELAPTPDGSVVEIPMMEPINRAPKIKKFQCQFVGFSQRGVKTGGMVESGSDFTFGWIIRNNGGLKWDDDCVLECVSGDPISLRQLDGNVASPPTCIRIPPLAADEECEVLGYFSAPTVENPQMFQSFWRIRSCGTTGAGEYFGQRLKLEVDVIALGMSLTERQYRRIEHMGFKDRRLIVQAMNESDGNMERAILWLVKQNAA